MLAIMSTINLWHALLLLQQDYMQSTGSLLWCLRTQHFSCDVPANADFLCNTALMLRDMIRGTSCTVTTQNSQVSLPFSSNGILIAATCISLAK
jgi:hypothetical protein